MNGKIYIDRMDKSDAERLRILLSRWSEVSLGPGEEEELGRLVERIERDTGNARLDCPLFDIADESAPVYDLYVSLRDMRLSERESEELDLFVGNLAAEEETENALRKRRTGRSAWIRIISAAACILIIFGLIFVVDNSFDDREPPTRLSMDTSGRLDSAGEHGMARAMVTAEIPADGITESGQSNLDRQDEDANSKEWSDKRGNSSYRYSGPMKSFNSSNSHVYNQETEWERCKRLLKEMDLDSRLIGDPAMEILGGDLDVQISTKVIVRDLIKEIAPAGTSLM